MKETGKPCGKLCYTQAGAKQALQGIASRRKAGKKKERKYYWCKACSAYHLSSQGLLGRRGGGK